MTRRRAWLGSGLSAVLFMVGCAQVPVAPANEGTPSWRGRLGMQLHGDPPQSFSAGFELRGEPERGELRLYSPLGNTVARLQWSPQSATLNRNGDIREFDSVDALLLQATGAAIPLAALFSWLQGQAAPAPGWQVDLSQHDAGRLRASRSEPLPRVELRVVLEP